MPGGEEEAGQVPTRDLILDVAEKRFAEHGFAGVSVRQIAADAGLKNQASLYHHFKNKRALYEAVIHRGMEPVLAVIARSKTEPAGPVLDRLIDHLSEKPLLPRLIWRAGLDESEDLRRIVAQALRPLFDMGFDALSRARLDWEEEDLPHLAFGLFQLIFGYFAQISLFEPITPNPPHSRAAIERQRRFLKLANARLMGRPRADKAAIA
jgi:AcrR family transcriptional regulator